MELNICKSDYNFFINVIFINAKEKQYKLMIINIYKLIINAQDMQILVTYKCHKK
jgi:hypothetical protein